MLAKFVSSFFDIVFILLIIYCLLSWIPNIDRTKQPFSLLTIFAETLLAPFRKILPPIGGFDFSPIIAFIVLQIVASIIISFVSRLGL